MGLPAVDYNFDGRTDNVGASPAAGWRPADWRAVEELLLLLARAVQQIHTYPPTSPLCISAIESCQRALAALENRDGLAFRVAPGEVIVDEVPTGRGTQVEQEVARRLHRASVAAVTIDRAVSMRELFRFVADLVRCGDRRAGDTTLQELLTEHGIDRITLRMAYRPEVLEVGAPREPVLEVVRRERARREELLTKGVVNYLYPPDKGWVRVDPSSTLTAVSLVDLAILTENPAVLAAMLLRLTDDASEAETPEAALEQKFSDVAMLFATLEPRLARQMFSRLARAVLVLDSERRQALLRRTVLPGLLDGRVDGTILRDFPDVELADSLCLLLDLETAAPELLTTALARLDLPTERQAAVVPLLEERLRERDALSAPDAGRRTTLAKHVRELVRVEHGPGKSFAEFAAFDLSLDTKATATLAQICEAVTTTDVLAEQLACVWHLSRLEPNPEIVQRFVDRAFDLLSGLERGPRHAELALWLARYRELADGVRETRPDVADVIAGKLAGFCTPHRAAWIAEQYGRGTGGREFAAAVTEALGPAIVPPLVALLARKDARDPRHATHAAGRAAIQLLTDHAVRLGPALVPFLDHQDPLVRRALVRVLGQAGPGYEQPIASQIRDGDEQTGREAMRSLARIGTAEAGALVAAEVERQRGWVGLAAEEALWHLPKAEAERQVRDLLGRREFVLRCPQAAARLLDRAAQLGATGLAPLLVWIVPRRFWFWSPAVARVARKAHVLLNP